jgi:hypothetical protein
MQRTQIASLALALFGIAGGLLLHAQTPKAQAPKAQALPDAATILDRYIEVTGGRAAYETHHTELLTGTIDFPAQGLKGKLTRYLAPSEEYSLMELDAIGTIESGISDGVAWEKSVLLGPRIKQGDEKQQALREAAFNAPLHWRELYPKAKTTGIVKINGADCYELLLTPATGQPEHQFYAQKTGLLARTTTVAASQMGDVDVQVDVTDYKSFGGVLMPTHSLQRAGSQELSITVDQVRINETFDEDRFKLPADVAAVSQKPPAQKPSAPPPVF